MVVLGYCVLYLVSFPPTDPVDKLRKEEKLGAYLDGTIETVDDEVGEMLDKMENDAREDIKRMRETAAANRGDAEEVGALVGKSHSVAHP